jgi:ribosomal-protein-serine acetyltransferase
MPSAPETLCTSMDGLTVGELRRTDTEEYHALVQRNVAHLTRFGDYRDEVAMTLDGIAEAFADDRPVRGRFGVRLEGRLVGRVDLVPVDPPRFGLGYWLGESATGRGLATEAVRAVLAHARGDLVATEIFAGVTHGNAASAALLARLGFEQVESFETYDRYRLVLGRDADIDGADQA